MSESNPYAPKGSVAKRLESKEVEVPSGTIDEVLAWVGEDTARAELALEAENSGHKRKTLTARLKELISG